MNKLICWALFDSETGDYTSTIHKYFDDRIDVYGVGMSHYGKNNPRYLNFNLADFSELFDGVGIGKKLLKSLPKPDIIVVNPLGEWTGGTNVDTGATNRKLGSDMGRAVTGGGLHGKDLSKADVAVNIACHKLAQLNNVEVQALCAIGDDSVEFRFADGTKEQLNYESVVEMARVYIEKLGGFERLAEWGLF